MYPAAVDTAKVVLVLGLRSPVSTAERLAQQVEASLPKSSLGAVARHVYGSTPDATALVGGRWNSPGLEPLYACQTYAGAMLECLAHAGVGRVPRTPVAIEIHIPTEMLEARRVAHALPPGWKQADLVVARRFGDSWLRERHTAALTLTTVFARHACHLQINPRHADFGKLIAGAPEQVVCAARLFGAARS